MDPYPFITDEDVDPIDVFGSNPFENYLKDRLDDELSSFNFELGYDAEPAAPDQHKQSQAIAVDAPRVRAASNSADHKVILDEIVGVHQYPEPSPAQVDSEEDDPAESFVESPRKRKSSIEDATAADKSYSISTRKSHSRRATGGKETAPTRSSPRGIAVPIKQKLKMATPSALLATTTTAKQRGLLSCPECRQKRFEDQLSLDIHIKKQHTRPYYCVFHFAGCASTFASKNEWKRHVASQHLLLRYWLCQEGSCAWANYGSPAASLPAPKNLSYNFQTSAASARIMGATAADDASRNPPLPCGSIFTRPDLYTHHVRRMHTPLTIKKHLEQQSRNSSSGGVVRRRLMPEWDDRLRSLASHAVRDRCDLPTIMFCPARHCDSEFRGADAWDQRMEHVGRHLVHAAAGEEPLVTFGGVGDPSLMEWATRPEVAVIRWHSGGWKLNNPFKRTIEEEMDDALYGIMASFGAVHTPRQGDGVEDDEKDDKDDDQLLDNAAGVSRDGDFARREPLSKDARATFTDSGYASAHYPPNARKALRAANESEENGPQKNAEDEDGNTIYTSQTTVATASVQQCILDVFNDMRSKLLPQLGDEAGAAARRRLPALLRAFAINLGIDSSNELGTEVMHFVHKHHRQITAHFETELSPEVDDLRAHDADNMSLSDKMGMWRKKANGIDTETKPDELFVGVEDEDEQDTSPDGSPSAYTEYILRSPAYKWFATTLSRELSLSWSDATKGFQAQNIQCTILSKLPTGTISRKRVPTAHRMSFRLPNTPRVPPRAGLLDTIVLTCSSNCNTQLTTVREYLDQRWSSDSLGILQLLQVVFTDNKFCSRDLPNKNQITATLDGSMLQVTGSGSAYFIAQLGEQLSWFSAALRVPPQSEDPVCYVSLLHEWNDGSFLIDSKPDFEEAPCHAACTDPRNLIRSLLLEGGESGRQISPTPVIAKGFPVARRPEGFLGLEVQFDIFLAILRLTDDALQRQLAYPSIIGLVVLRSPFKAFQVVKRANGAILWHMLLSPYHVCLCFSALSIVTSNDAMERLTANNIRSYRHIIGQCSRPDDPNQPKAAAETQHIPPTTDAAGHDLGSWLLPRTEHVPSQSHDAMSADTDLHSLSLDSDLLSISDSSASACIEPLEIEDRRIPIINKVTGILMSAFASERLSRPYGKTKFRCVTATSKPASEGSSQDTNTAQTENSHDSGGFSNSCANPAGTASRHGMPRKKRPRNRESNDREEEDDSSDSSSAPRKKAKSSGDPSKLLACPFWKQNPGKYRDCFRKKLFKINRVKQHLGRKHTPSFYCQRCMAIFSDSPTHHAHVKLDPPCRPSDDQLDGLSPQQSQEVRRRSKPGSTDTEQWFSIWDIAFPDSARPRSPYLDADLCEELHQFEGYWARHGSTILARELLGSSSLMILSMGTGEDTEAILRRVLADGLDQIVREWLLSRSPNNNDNNNVSAAGLASVSEYDDHSHQTLSIQSQATLGSSLADSAIGLSSDASLLTPIPHFATSSIPPPSDELLRTLDPLLYDISTSAVGIENQGNSIL